MRGGGSVSQIGIRWGKDPAQAELGRATLGDKADAVVWATPPAGLRSGAENRDVRPGAVRSDDGAVPALGSQSVVVDVRIAATISHINR